MAFQRPLTLPRKRESPLPNLTLTSREKKTQILFGTAQNARPDIRVASHRKNQFSSWTKVGDKKWTCAATNHYSQDISKVWCVSLMQIMKFLPNQLRCSITAWVTIGLVHKTSYVTPKKFVFFFGNCRFLICFNALSHARSIFWWNTPSNDWSNLWPLEVLKIVFYQHLLVKK